MTTEEAIDWQKREILNLVERAEDADQLKIPRNLYELCYPLWESLNYLASSEEVRSIIYCKAVTLRKEEQDYLEHCRQNCRTRAGVSLNIAKLSEIAKSMK